MIIILGTAAKGGIDGVIKDHICSGIFEGVGYKRIITHLGVSSFGDLTVFISSIVKFMFVLMSGKVSLVHAHMSYNGSFWRKLVFLALSKTFRKKFICHLHGSEFKSYVDKSSSLRLFLIKTLIRQSDSFIVLSDGWAEFIKSISGVDATVINNFVDVPNKFNYSSRKIKNPQMVFIGAFIARKGVIELLEAYSLSNTDYILHMCGDGPLLPVVQSKIKQLGLQDRVYLHGWVDFDTKMNLLSESSLFVLPTYNEGLPLTVIEAFAAGAVVITSPVGAIPEFVTNGHNGYLVGPGDISALADVIKALATHEDVIKRVSENAVRTYEENFTSAVVLPKIKETYARLGIYL